MQSEKSEDRKTFASSGNPDTRDVASCRSQIYVVLSRGFWYPDHPSTSFEGKPGHVENPDEDGRGISFSSPAFWDGFSQLINSIDIDGKLGECSHQWRMAALRESEENEIASRNEEYTRLFAHIKTVKAPPYETEYGNDHIFMKAHQLADINGFYYAFGMKPGKGINERPDHLSVECEFMGLLTLKEAYALEYDQREKADITLDAQRKFLEEHLGRWATLFSEIVMKETRLPFYKKASAFLKTFLQWDAKWLDVSPKPIDKPRLNVDNLPI